MAVRGNNNIIQQQHFRSNYSFYGSPGFSNSPGVSSGTQAFSFNFTPKSSSSEIYLESSIHTIYEDSNSADQAFVLAHYDSTIITISYAPTAYFLWNSYYNCAFIALQGYENSWGTSQKTIKIDLVWVDLVYIIIEHSNMQTSTVVLTEITTYIIL